MTDVEEDGASVDVLVGALSFFTASLAGVTTSTFLAVGGALLVLRFIARITRKPLSKLRGPKASSLLAGYEYDLFNQKSAGDKEYKWYQEYGTAFRATGAYGVCLNDFKTFAENGSDIDEQEEVLMTADPKALQYILQTSGYRFSRPIEFQRRISRLFDKGVLWAEGEHHKVLNAINPVALLRFKLGDIHQRHRKVLNPAFSAQQLKQFLAIFQESVSHLARKWKEDISQGGLNEKQINIPFWLGRMSLDIIGKSTSLFIFGFSFSHTRFKTLNEPTASFDFDFGALDNKDGVPLRNKFQNLFQDSVQPSKANMIHRTLERYAPSIFRMFPSKENLRHLDFLNETHKIARDIYARKDLVVDNDEKKGGKDILSVLAHANNAEDSRKKLNDSEVLAQVATMLNAGQETISFSTTYLLYELSRHLEDQTRVFREIRNLRDQIGQDTVPSSNDYDSMPYFNAVIKEALRLHSILADVQREALNDDVIPLEFPITTAAGETVNQIPVRKGQRIYMSLGASNR
ncbi:cytochrome P450 [Dendrothele bispora CBS 962.96]|uniref:Cytochrome P450 n=1 Tax=Dendrothele bispora (strain CBS 962.96) TaxID=1314807 RepID=A0A4S8M621_DENBC|nr:cytochrome P450 [Dendrothele bispora CBS 962.96]